MSIFLLRCCSYRFLLAFLYLINIYKCENEIFQGLMIKDVRVLLLFCDIDLRFFSVQSHLVFMFCNLCVGLGVIAQ